MRKKFYKIMSYNILFQYYIYYNIRYYDSAFIDIQDFRLYLFIIIVKIILEDKNIKSIKYEYTYICKNLQFIHNNNLFIIIIQENFTLFYQ